jgi:uncharacterized protein YndB with AHSA1/START domain
MESLTVERSVWIAAPRERVWQAITDATEINQWWGGDDHWDITALQVGGTIKFGDPADPMIATIAVVDPPRQFKIEWPPQPQYYAVSMSTSYLLEDENGGTRVTVIETGFEALPDEIRQQRFEQTAEGYATVLQGLKAYLEHEQS